MKKIAIIPARSGSKGLKDKNIIELCGKPLMAYSIEAALKSECFDRVIVSTDSEGYGGIAEKFGAEVMYRGEALSSDTATTYMVLEDILGHTEGDIDYFVLLQPTSPMRTERHVLEAAELFEKNSDKFDFLVSVKEAEHPSVLVKPIGEDMSLRYFDTDFSSYRRQGYKDYSPNGAIFIAKPDRYLERKHFFGEKTLAYIMSREDSVDIDDRIDYELAKILMKERG
ncbi:MAG: acylneuraminate cytidylyltransferase family protein [Oscillospiraceae bacterium]|nr:acylneuraminate cytidylyltransferase family protein [Oscillospiraceae bacterium]